MTDGAVLAYRRQTAGGGRDDCKAAGRLVQGNPQPARLQTWHTVPSLLCRQQEVPTMWPNLAGMALCWHAHRARPTRSAPSSTEASVCAWMGNSAAMPLPRSSSLRPPASGKLSSASGSAAAASGGAAAAGATCRPLCSLVALSEAAGEASLSFAFFGFGGSAAASSAGFLFFFLTLSGSAPGSASIFTFLTFFGLAAGSSPSCFLAFLLALGTTAPSIVGEVCVKALPHSFSLCEAVPFSR